MLTEMAEFSGIKCVLTHFAPMFHSRNFKGYRMGSFSRSGFKAKYENC